MSSFLTETVPIMPPLSLASIEEIGNRVVEELCPGALTVPTPLDLPYLVDFALPKYGVHMYPVTEVELGDRLAATDPSGEKEINILIAEDHWNLLFAGGRRAYQPRATVAHELAHAILHVPVVRARLRHPLGHNLLSRVRRDSIPAYRDPEWQAWALAGCVLAPRQAVELANTRSVSELAEMFTISSGMMLAHLKRLRLTGRFPEP